MNDSQKYAFKDLMERTYTMYSRSPPIQSEIRIWWESLKEYKFEVVSLAFSEHIKNNKFLPRVAEIRAIIKLTEDKEKAGHRIPLIHHKMSPTERKEGLRRLHIAKENLK